MLIFHMNKLIHIIVYMCLPYLGMAFQYMYFYIIFNLIGWSLVEKYRWSLKAGYK